MGAGLISSSHQPGHASKGARWQQRRLVITIMSQLRAPKRCCCQHLIPGEQKVCQVLYLSASHAVVLTGWCLSSKSNKNGKTSVTIRNGHMRTAPSYLPITFSKTVREPDRNKCWTLRRLLWT